MSNSQEILGKIDPLNKIMLSNNKDDINRLLEDLCKKVHMGALDQIMTHIENAISKDGEVDFNDIKKSCIKSEYIQF